jgi:hypothetical protein
MDNHEIWYHGSPYRLEVLRAGSTVTQTRELAEVFSHKPVLVSIEDDGTIRHNGSLPGYLYVVAEPVGPEDVYPHPRTTMGPGFEWLTTRELSLAPVATVEISKGEPLTADEVARFMERRT